MQTLWMDLADLFGNHGQSFRITANGVYHACPFCEDIFPQTDEGWKALQEHKFLQHECLIMFNWIELQGKRVTIGVVERENNDGYGHSLQRELIARDDDGVVYFLPFSYYDSDDERGFKCKPKPRLLKNLTSGDLK